MKESFASYKKGDIVIAQRCVNLHAGINKGDEWMICEAETPEEVAVLDTFTGTVFAKRGEERVLFSAAEFSYIFEGGESLGIARNTDDREKNNWLCRRMEHDLKAFTSDKAVWCERCLFGNEEGYDIHIGVENEKGELVCGGCGFGDALDDACFGGDEAPYAITYEIDSALEDRGYLSVVVRDWQHSLFLDPFERTIEVYDSGLKQNLLYIHSGVDEELCDRLIDEARKNVASWVKDPENWDPEL